MAYSSTSILTAAASEPGRARDAHATGMLMMHAVLAALGAVFFQLRLWAGQPMTEQVGVASFALILLCVWMLISWRLATGTLFDPYGLFMMAAMPFHAGYSLLRLMGFEAGLLVRAEITDALLARTLLLILASMAALHLGALLVRVWTDRTAPRPPTGARVAESDLRLVGWALIALTIVPTTLEFRGYLDAVLVGGYQELFLTRTSGAEAGAFATLIDLITPFFIPGVMFLLAGSRRSRIGRMAATILLAGYSLAYLWVGFRAYALIPVAVLLWVWHVTIRPLPLRTLAVAGGAFFILIAPLVRTFRGLSGAERFSPDAILQAYGSVENPIVRLIGELGSSMFTISYTAQLVPDVRPHEWGVGYARALLNAVPIIDIPNPFGDAGVWLAWEIRPEWAAGGFAFGYSFIAEAFLNFGWLGAPLFLMLLGGAIVGTARWALRSGDPARIAFLASFLPLLLFFVRGESVNLARPVLWYALIPFAAVHLLRRYRTRVGIPASDG